MARYSSFQRAFWQDDFVLELSPEEKFFYIYLFTNEQVTMCGIYKFSKKIACFETGYNLDTINKLIRRFTDYGKIVYSEETQEICLVNFIKNNYFGKNGLSDKIIQGIQKGLAAVKNTSLINHLQGLDTLSIPYIYPMDTVSIPYIYPMDTVCIPLPLTGTDNSITGTENSITETRTVTGKQDCIENKADNTEQGQITDFKTVKSVLEQKSRLVTSTPDGMKQEQVTENRRRLDIEYEALFDLYPKKTHHDTGFNAYINAYSTRQLPSFERLKQAIESQKKSQQWQNLTYVPSIANWIKQARWKDILATVPEQSEADREQSEHAKKVEALRTWALANGFKESEIFLTTTTAAYKKAMGLT